MTNEELLARLDERQKSMMEKMDEIHTGVKTTNGRVTALENWRSEIRGSWRATVLLSSIIGTVLGSGITILLKDLL